MSLSLCRRRLPWATVVVLCLPMPRRRMTSRPPLPRSTPTRTSYVATQPHSVLSISQRTAEVFLVISLGDNRDHYCRSLDEAREDTHFFSLHRTTSIPDPSGRCIHICVYMYMHMLTCVSVVVWMCWCSRRRSSSRARNKLHPR